ncbi:MAG: bacillithiol system redox-active protein YtxJ [Cytophagales bacterium]|nr:bacillithiol system redox-active protein YtxJ [Cytophagales bacterium]
MNWNRLEKVEDLDEVTTLSEEKPVILFKHSTRCSISAATLNRLERNWDESEMKNSEIFYLDLIRFRDISNKIAEKFGVPHQSPQVLVIKNGESIHDASHFGVDYQSLNKVVNG